MNRDDLVQVENPLAASPSLRAEQSRDGVLQPLVGLADVLKWVHVR